MILGTLERYIGRSILFSTGLVLLVLLALAAIFGLIAELSDVGRGNYKVSTAMHYTALTMPGMAYMLFAPAVLLGSLLGLGGMASNSELTVMRAAGVSHMQIVRAVLITGFGLMICVMLLGEYVVPKSEQVAEKLRLTALEKRFSVNSGSGMWVKSGEKFVNIASVMPDYTLLELSVYEYEDKKLSKLISIGKAEPKGEGWQLSDLLITDLTDENSHPEVVESAYWENLVKAEVLQSISISPESLSARKLYDQVQYLKSNQLDTDRIELAFWNKIANPFASLVMLMLSLPFVFGNQRSGGAGQKIFIGIMLGIGFMILNRLLTQVGLTAGLSPAASAVLPLLLFVAIAFYGIKMRS